MIHHISVDDEKTIQETIDEAIPGDTIVIGRGIYKEKVHIRTDNISLWGEGDCNDSTIITYDDCANKTHEDGELLGTFRSYTCLVQAKNVTLRNLTIENSAGDGREVGQGIALYADGDRLTCVDCQLLGHQDTLFAGPLPEKARIPGSFVGPSEHSDYNSTKQYYKRCQITGDVDYIFGSAMAVFDGCTMTTRNRNLKVNGYIAAPSTWEQEPYGFVFINSHFVGERGMAKGSVFFARPWRPFAQVLIIGCHYDESIHEDQFDMWGDETNRETTKFEIYKSVSEKSLGFLDLWHIKIINEYSSNRN